VVNRRERSREFHATRRHPPAGGPRLSVEHLDVYLVVVLAPIALLIGAPTAGYAIGAAGWVLLRGFGAAAGRRAMTITHVSGQAALRLSYRLVRVAALAGATVVALSVGGTADGLAAVLVMAFAFSVRLVVFVREAGRSRPSRG
jgi:hypothetical protein